VSVLLVIGIGLFLGAVHGALIAWIHIPAFVVTLGGLLVYRGVLLLVAKITIPIDADLVNHLGSGVISPVVAWLLTCGGLIIFVVISISKRRAFRQIDADLGPSWKFFVKILLIGLTACGVTFWLNQSEGMPVRFLLMVLLALVISLVATRFRFGRHVYAIGGNREAAFYSGIRVEWHLVGVFAIMGGIAALAGLVSSGIQRAADAGAGELMELYAIAACVIGGTSLRGGKGTVFGSILGALIMATIRNGLSCLGVPSSGEKIILGLILVTAVGLDLTLSGKKS